MLNDDEPVLLAADAASSSGVAAAAVASSCCSVTLDRLLERLPLSADLFATEVLTASAATAPLDAGRSSPMARLNDESSPNRDDAEGDFCFVIEACVKQ